MEGPPTFPGSKSTKHDNNTLQYGNIKERLNLHVKRRLNVQPEYIVQNNSQMPKEAKFAPTEISNDALTSGTVLGKNTTTSQQLHQFPKATRRPYTKRKDKTRTPIVSNNLKTDSSSASIESLCPVKFVINKNILNAVPVIAIRKYNKRRKLPPAENIMVTSTNEANDAGIGSGVGSGSTGGTGGGGDEDSQDVEVRGRLNERDKGSDILSVVLNLKKRSLMQCPEIQEVIRSLSNAYKN